MNDSRHPDPRPAAPGPSIYRGMDRACLDRAYNNILAVADFPAVLERFRTGSARTYWAHPCLRDGAYGSGARQRFDWFPCGRVHAPVFIFIHGGYWQATAKEDFAFIANGPLAHGFDVVMVEYTLAPDASMSRIVAEIGSLLDHLAASDGQFGLKGREVVLSGHSAGGHLTALYRDHPAVSWALPISALVDLEPISLCWLNDKLRLSADEIARFSPLRHMGPGVPTLVAVGAAELPELQRHSREYVEAGVRSGGDFEALRLPGHDHFSVLDDLARSSGALMAGLRALMTKPRPG